MDETSDEMMNAEQAPEPEQQHEGTNADDMEPEGDLEESAEGALADATTDGVEEISPVGVSVGADSREEDVAMEYVGGTVEEPETAFNDSTPVESSVQEEASAPEGLTDEPIAIHEEQDLKRVAEDSNDVEGARVDLEEKQPKRKRIRRVGLTPVRAIPKTEEGPESHDPTADGDVPLPIMAPTEVGTEGTEREIKQEDVVKEETKDEETDNKEATGTDGSGIDDSKPAETADVADDPTPNTPIPGTYADGVYISTTGTRVLSKHDEKWRNMFEKLIEYIKQNGNTAVPQCYHEDPQLGRWVHYQRVEYWIYQQTGSGKISDARINRLNSIGFEWNPQQAQWETMFTKLKQFKEEIGHCRVPKGYSKDPELANWVRNQRLEQANFEKKKKTRMTPERYKLLDDMGFKWSSPTPSRSRKSTKKGGEEEGKEDSIKSEEDAEGKEGAVLDEAVATAAAAAAAAAVVSETKEEPADEAKEGTEQGEEGGADQEAVNMEDHVKEESQAPSVVKAEAAIEV